MALLSSKALKPLHRGRHQVRRSRQIPVGVGDFGVSKIGRQRGHDVVNLRAIRLPELHAAANKGMSQIMHAGRRMSPARFPAELFAKAFEDPMDGPLGRTLTRVRYE